MRLLTRLYAEAPEDISGAEVSWRTVPWMVPWWLGGLADALTLGAGVAGSIVLLALTVVVWVGWWSRIGRHWHPVRRLWDWRR